MKTHYVKVIEIKREEFDHGGTKNKAILASSGDIILLLSQDVLPIRSDYIEELITPLIQDERIAASSGRQIAYDSASLREKLVRQFNYKNYSFVRDKSDLSKLGIKTFFLSDCCSAYRREAIDSVGLYNEPNLICCDMILAAKLVYAGYKIAYTAEAEVYHSHDYSIVTQYKRNFDTGAEIAINGHLFGNVEIKSEGVKLVKFVLKELVKKGHFIMGIHFCVDCVARLKGHNDGIHYRRYSKEQIKKRSLNLSFWDKISW